MAGLGPSAALTSNVFMTHRSVQLTSGLDRSEQSFCRWLRCAADMTARPSDGQTARRAGYCCKLRAHLSRLRRISTMGKHSRVLCGPGDGFGACTRTPSVSLRLHRCKSPDAWP